ncbi:secretin receptor-like isoform X2 [Harpegnathos saltator]|uniref:secretin receptor-like isoform X2 n=1 Tax=Harpegnathos saltator TaxID=610380 RepID=UPI000DBEEDEB|nr:secretin receptor-like isoform X2 [Harpegnathos saltator]
MLSLGIFLGIFDPLQICRVLYVLFHYFLLTNYAWMFCEGFYLRTLLVNAFTNEHKLVNWLMGLGWSMATVIVTLYTALRASSNDPADTEQASVWPLCGGTYRLLQRGGNGAVQEEVGEQCAVAEMNLLHDHDCLGTECLWNSDTTACLKDSHSCD